MTTERTTDPIAVQASAIEVLAELAHRYPELPAPYVTIHSPWLGAPSKLDLLLHTPTEFNRWMTVLGVVPEDVSLHMHGRGSWIEAETVQAGIHLSISVHDILLTEDQLNAPRDRGEVAA